MLTSFEYFIQVWSTILAKSDITFSNLGISKMFNVFNFEKNVITFLMNSSFSSLFFVIVLLWKAMYSSTIGIVLVKGVWSDVRHYSGWIECMFSSEELQQRNIKLMTEFESLVLLEYLVETWLIEYNRLKLKESAITKRLSLMEEWWLNNRSHKVSQILKSPVITRRFWMLNSVFLRYFITEWEESE